MRETANAANRTDAGRRFVVAARIGDGAGRGVATVIINPVIVGYGEITTSSSSWTLASTRSQCRSCPYSWRQCTLGVRFGYFAEAGQVGFPVRQVPIGAILSGSTEGPGTGAGATLVGRWLRKVTLTMPPHLPGQAGWSGNGRWCPGRIGSGHLNSFSQCLEAGLNFCLAQAGSVRSIGQISTGPGFQHGEGPGAFERLVALYFVLTMNVTSVEPPQNGGGVGDPTKPPRSSLTSHWSTTSNSSSQSSNAWATSASFTRRYQSLYLGQSTIGGGGTSTVKEELQLSEGMSQSSR